MHSAVQLKKAAFIFLFLFVVMQLPAQTWNWGMQSITPMGTVANNWVGSNNYYAYGQPNGIAMDSSYNVFITGYFQDTLHFGAATIGTPMQVSGSFLAKYDSSGNFLWVRQSSMKTPGPSSAYGENTSKTFSVATDKTGNSFETGFFHDTVYLGATALISHAFWNSYSWGDVYLVKYDPSGNVLWARQSNGAVQGSAWGTSAVVDSAGNSYVSGEFADTLKFGSTTLLTTTASGVGSNYFLVKYDPSGNLLWAKESSVNYGPGYGPSNLALDAKANIYMSAVFTGTFQWGVSAISSSSSNGRSAFITKMDNNGNAIWMQQIHGDSLEQWGCSQATDRNGNTYLGVVYNNNIYFGPFHFYNPQSSMLLAKCNNNGTVIWAESFTNVNGWFNGSSADNAGHIYMLGAIGQKVIIGTDTLTIPNTNGGEALVKLDTAGNVMCSSVINGDMWGDVVAEPNGKGAFVTGAISDSNHFGADIVGPPNTNYQWPFVVRWSGCRDDDFYTYGKGFSPCKNQCNGKVSATTSGGYAPFTYSWSTSPKQTTQTATGLCAGNYTVAVTDSLGHSASQQVTVPPYTNNLLLSAGKDSICEGNSTALSASGTLGYTWTPTTGLSCSTCPAPIATPTANTTYIVSGTDTLGCTDTSTITIHVLQQPTINSNGNICAGNSFTINANGGSSYVWNTGSKANSIAVSPDTTTKYYVIVNVYKACTDTLYNTVTVRQIPVITLCCDSTITPGESVQLIATGGGSYMWQPNTWLNCDTCSSPVASPLETTTYSLVVSNASNCTTTEYVTIDVDCNIFIPQAFSPNGDGVNDYLYVRGKCIRTMDFIIFDRWGNKVFESESLSMGWDGRDKGQPMNTGTYSWVLTGNLYDGSTFEKKGSVELIR